jgi:hypothetical protein
MNTAIPAALGLPGAIEWYFQGEKIEALVFILPIGLLSLVFGVWLLADGVSSFTRGVAIPFLVMGLVMTAVGGLVGLRAPSQVAQLQQGLQTDPQLTMVRESARMEKVNKAWGKYLVLWGLMGALGMALRFATASDFTRGLGIALVLFSGVGLMVDGFAERRAHAYAALLAGASSAPTTAAPGVSR